MLARIAASPASNGGRGLKQLVVGAQGAHQNASPASNGGRGLKLDVQEVVLGRHRIARQQWRARIETKPTVTSPPSKPGIARQQWRARIETSLRFAECGRCGASPASNGGRGLKHVEHRPRCATDGRIARQQWRARIETRLGRPDRQQRRRIARQQWRARIETPRDKAATPTTEHRPPAMAGAD